MKKVFALAALLLALLAFASCAKKQGGMNYKEVEGGLAITGYTDKTTVTELTVPDEIDGVPVVRIEDFGICNAESLTKITIGKNVASLGGWALTNNQHLTEFAVDPANEHFTAVDGVLFDAEMKTLLRYPHGATAEHYDVPRGVERIADFAFDSDDQNSPLKTISLPIGLREIGEYAFYALGRLNSVTIPPTVTRLAETAFGGCVSLERVSLPEGLEVELDTWGKLGDFTYYNGDNGTTGADMGTAADPHIYAYALLASEDGSPVPVYADAYTDHPLRYLPNGITVVLNSSENGRCRAHPEDEYRNRFWVDIRFLQLINPDEAEDE